MVTVEREPVDREERRGQAAILRRYRRERRRDITGRSFGSPVTPGRCSATVCSGCDPVRDVGAISPGAAARYYGLL